MYVGSTIYFCAVGGAFIAYSLVRRRLKTVKRCPQCLAGAARRTGPDEPTGETEKVMTARFEVHDAEFTCQKCRHVFRARV